MGLLRIVDALGSSPNPGNRRVGCERRGSGRPRAPPNEIAALLFPSVRLIVGPRLVPGLTKLEAACGFVIPTARTPLFSGGRAWTGMRSVARHP